MSSDGWQDRRGEERRELTAADLQDPPFRVVAAGQLRRPAVVAVKGPEGVREPGQL